MAEQIAVIYENFSLKQSRSVFRDCVSFSFYFPPSQLWQVYKHIMSTWQLNEMMWISQNWHLNETIEPLIEKNLLPCPWDICLIQENVKIAFIM